MSDNREEKQTDEKAQERKKTRLLRLKEKLKNLKKKDPNIYPMW